MKTILLLTASILIATQGFSQRFGGGGLGDGAGSSGGSNMMFDFHSRTIDLNQKALAFGLAEAEFAAIKDQAYLNTNFLVGNIYQDENLLKSNVPMRYNAYADEIEIKNHISEENYGALMKDPSIYAKISKDIYVFIPYDGSNEKGGYFNVLNDGKTYDLYKKTTSLFREPQKAKTSYGRDTPPSFTKNVKYYLVEDGSFLEMPSRKSKVIKMMDKKKTEIKAYIKDNDINMNKEADMIKLVSYFDSLL